MKRLLIAADVDDSLRTRARENGRFEIIDRPVNSEDELASIAGDCDILVTRSYNRVSKRVLAAAFGMRVMAFDPYISDDDFAQRGATRVTSLDALLRDSDILTLHVPFTPETRTMIGARALALLPSGAIVINAARGEVLHLDAALDALNRNALGGLAIDVYDPEPPTRAWPDDPRLILTPP